MISAFEAVDLSESWVGILRVVEYHNDKSRYPSQAIETIRARPLRSNVGVYGTKRGWFRAVGGSEEAWYRELEQISSCICQGGLVGDALQVSEHEGPEPERAHCRAGSKIKLFEVSLEFVRLGIRSDGLFNAGQKYQIRGKEGKKTGREDQESKGKNIGKGSTDVRHKTLACTLLDSNLPIAAADIICLSEVLAALVALA